MDAKLFAVVFGTIFVAELGDKTQLATLLYASDADNHKLTVFAASALALVGVAAADGKFLWRYDKPACRTGISCSTPLFHDGTVFAASASALVLTSAIGVLAGSVVAHSVGPKVVSWIAGIGFIAIGLWILLRG